MDTTENNGTKRDLENAQPLVPKELADAIRRLAARIEVDEAGAKKDCSCEACALLRENHKLRSVTGWQPIESAPRDGTPILLGWINSGVSEGLWRDGVANYWKLPGFYFTDDDPLTAKPCSPTHWMPFPEPPK